MNKITFFLITFWLFFAVGSLTAQASENTETEENKEAVENEQIKTDKLEIENKNSLNSTPFSLLLSTAFGGGTTGVDLNDTSQSGLGYGAKLSSLFRLYFVGIETEFSYLSLGNIDYDVPIPSGAAGHSEGHGHYWKTNLLLGYMGYIRPGQMGHAFFYLGMGWADWERTQTKSTIKVDGSIASTNEDEIVTRYNLDNGAILLGFRLLGTRPYENWSLIWSLGFQFKGVVPKSISVENLTTGEKNEYTGVEFDGKETGGANFEIGLGAAFKEYGLGVYLNCVIMDSAIAVADFYGNYDPAIEGSEKDEINVYVGAYYELAVRKQFDF
ncbi:MAG: hypothetical protein OEZ22_13485 [Spirochaetia bacterium]|nr:hypothetical protein [Spirochaetia bacterium]